jgi:hypothetical protein
MVGAFQQMLAHALHNVFMVGTVICIAALISVIFMPPHRLIRRETM